MTVYQEPAFPNEVHFNPGMTLRDYFAAKAMQSLIAGESQGEWDDDATAKGAYRIADAMLRAREAK